MPTIRGHEHLGDLRLTDLIAKTAKTNMRDAIRVLIAARQVSLHFDLTLNELVPDNYTFSTDRPTSQNVAACEQAYAELERHGERAVAAIASFK